MLRDYNSRGFKVKNINCEREFKKIMDEVKDSMGVDMNYTNADDHVPAGFGTLRAIPRNRTLCV